MIRLSPINKGTYIIAVSGGVDSVVLLDLLKKEPGLQLVIAHIDHGIRDDSEADQLFVKDLAKQNNLLYESIALHLKPNCSEQEARQQRYEFLQKCRKKYKADAIITAHHQDDVLETIIINIIRGTGWRGLSSLRSHQMLLRPLLHVSKKEIILYAQKNHLTWHEDSTNSNTKYLRNYVRHTMVSRIHERPEVQNKIYELWHQQIALAADIATEIGYVKHFYVATKDGRYEIDRYAIIMLPSKVACELLQAVTKECAGFSLEQPQVENILLFAKVAAPQKEFLLGSKIRYRVTTSSLIVEPTHI